MKKALYVGIYSDGTTSKMRADILRTLLSDWKFEVIDTDIPKTATSRIWQSIGFRFKVGPMIKNINSYIEENIKNDVYDLIWVDKASFLKLKLTQQLKSKTKCLIHYTPDPAFKFHGSREFNRCLSVYDLVVTTKSFEMESYLRHVDDNKLLLVTQGFDKNLHRPLCDNADKEGLVFIGHYEKKRAKIIKTLINAGIKVKVCGTHWARFIKQNRDNNNLVYLGVGLYNDDYVRAISRAQISWGSISKWFPEKHTTRTFEIPACGTALLTERNPELESFYNEDEVIFYTDSDNLVERVRYYFTHIEELERLSQKGYERVHKDGRDYESIIKNILHLANVI